MRNFVNSVWHMIERLVYAVLNKGFKILKRELTDEKFVTFMQFIKFGIVGVSNTAISYVLYVISLLIFRNLNIFSELGYLIAQVIAFILSVLWSFYWNNKMVFTPQEGKKRSLWCALVKTYISYSFTGLFLSSALLILWVQVCHISELIAPIINLIVSVPLNFIINKFWAFRDAK